MKRSSRQAPDKSALDRRASTLLGGVAIVVGLLILAPGLLLLSDKVIHVEVLSCSLLVGVPTVLFGIRQLTATLDARR